MISDQSGWRKNAAARNHGTARSLGWFGCFGRHPLSGAAEAEPSCPLSGAIFLHVELRPGRGPRIGSPSSKVIFGASGLGHSLCESATFAFGSVGQLTTVVARPGTALRVEVLAESSPCDAGEPQGPFSQAPGLSCCFRRPAGRNHGVPTALYKQPAAHFPSPCSVGYPGRSREWLRPCLFRLRPF
jgi:hypothetical protein